MCNYTSNVGVRATAVWTLNKVPIPITGNERISTDEISLIFSPLMTSDSGEYSCTLNIMSLMQYVAIVGGVTMTKIDVQSKLFVLWSKLYNLADLFPISFIVPPPRVVVSVNRTGPLYVGTGITLTCTVTLDMSVNNNETVTIQWSGVEGMDEVFRNNDTGLSDTQYTSNLIISPLTAEHRGLINCTATVRGGSVNQIVSNSNVTVLNIDEGESACNLVYSSVRSFVHFM